MNKLCVNWNSNSTKFVRLSLTSDVEKQFIEVLQVLNNDKKIDIMNSRKKSYNRSSTAVNKRSNLGEQQVTINDLKIKATIRKDNY